MLFISYSHQDVAFVDRLVARFVQRRVAFWWDRIEIKVGESLLDRVQGAISQASLLVVVLSKSSVASEWCKQELNAGLMRQLSERQVRVLPVLIERCTIPAFLSDKKYADFLADFEVGFESLMQSIAASADRTLGRKEEDLYLTDYGLHWEVHNGKFLMEIEAASSSKVLPCTVLSRIQAVGNEIATHRYRQYLQLGFEDTYLTVVAAYCESALNNDNAYCVVESNIPLVFSSHIEDEASRIRYDLTIRVRRIGEHTETALVFHYGTLFGGVLQTLIAGSRQLSPAEQASLASLMLKNADNGE